MKHPEAFSDSYVRCVHSGNNLGRLFAVLFEQPVEGLLLADGELARLDARMVHTKKCVDVVHRLRAYVCELLDLSGDVLDLHTRTS